MVTSALCMCVPAKILGQLEQCRTFPDFNNYLAFIFAQGDSLPLEVVPFLHGFYFPLPDQWCKAREYIALCR